jgi:predicted MPP superfamily phosphohydrolase
MQSTLQPRTCNEIAESDQQPPRGDLIEKLGPRIATEERFARAGGKAKTKSFFRRHEKRYITPVIKFGLKTLGVYRSGEQQARKPVVSHVELHFADLPRSFDGFRLVHLSDLHIDGVDGLTEALAPVLESIDADLCVMSGDYRFEDEGPCEEIYRRMRTLLPAMAAPHGTYGILGNHDEAAIAFQLEALGIRMLINEAVEIRHGGESVWLAGLDDDFDYKCDDLPSALANVPPRAFKILLAHSPDLHDRAATRGVHLYLCGHTHGGQVRIPYIGALRSNAKSPRRYTYGHWIHRGMHGYTSGGIGCASLPVRLNCPPEVVVLTLRCV